MESSKIRWTDSTWNPGTGCTQISPGCAHCYAKTIAEKFRGNAFPNGFAPVWKPGKVGDPLKWKAARRIFVNSMSDLFHETFTFEQIASAFEVMCRADWHTYQVLTKRPARMLAFVTWWLAQTGRTTVPMQIWLGVSIENYRWVGRADILRQIPVPVRFISAEPLLTAVPTLDLTDIAWLIVGGESGPKHRIMSHQWARDLRAKAEAAGTAFFFKQSSGARTEMGIELDGVRYEQYPDPAEWESRLRGGSHQGTARRYIPEIAAAQIALL